MNHWHMIYDDPVFIFFEIMMVLSTICLSAALVRAGRKESEYRRVSRQTRYQDQGQSGGAKDPVSEMQSQESEQGGPVPVGAGG